MTKYERENEKNKRLSEEEMIAGMAALYAAIRSLSKDIASSWRERSPDENGGAWLQKNKRNTKLQKDINGALRPEYKKVDNFIEKRYEQEYNTQYYRAAYGTVQEYREAGYGLRINKYLNSDFEKAVTNPLSKYTQPLTLRNDRGKSMQSIYNAIREGIINGESLQTINKNIDVQLGYRDRKTGKLIAKPENYKGDFSKRLRVLRTEIGRIRSNADTQEWLTEQEQGIDSQMIYTATLDNRTRAQSAQMDGQPARKDGKYQYPDGNYYFQKNTGNPAWDINDRCTSTKINTDESIEDYARTRKIGKDSEIVPYENYYDYAKSLGMVKNKYGQTLFPDRS